MGEFFFLAASLAGEELLVCGRCETRAESGGGLGRRERHTGSDGAWTPGLAGSQQVRRSLAGGVACASCQRCFLEASMTDDHTSRCPSESPLHPPPRLFDGVDDETTTPHATCRYYAMPRWPHHSFLVQNGLISVSGESPFSSLVRSRHLISARRVGSSNRRRERRRETRRLKFSICAEHRSSQSSPTIWRHVTTLPWLRANPTIWPRRIGDGARFTMASGASMPPANPRVDDGPPCVSLVDGWCIISIPHLHVYAGSPALSASSPTRVWGLRNPGVGCLWVESPFSFSSPPLPPSPRLVRQQAPNMICLEGGRPLFCLFQTALGTAGLPGTLY